ncbi:MAG: DUF3054 domain-containing protein [Promicromonosporaceae bacterium]|nr:DUF3054 domain-containing protein [Promicromonosporaceae bacterium]
MGSLTVGRAAVYDAVMVIVFLLLGTASHDSAKDGTAHVVMLGVVFLVGLAAGWGASRAWRSPGRLWPTGVIVWLVTVAVGVGLRGVLVSDAGYAPSFLVVATVALGVLLLGWRALFLIPPRRAS